MHTFVCPLANRTKYFYPCCYAIVNEQREIIFLYGQYDVVDIELLQWNISYGIQVDRKLLDKQCVGRPVWAIYQKEKNRFLKLQQALLTHANQMQLVTIELSKDSQGVLGVKDAKMLVQTFELDGWDNMSRSYMQTNGQFHSYVWQMFFFMRTDGPPTILLCGQEQMIEIESSNIGVDQIGGPSPTIGGCLSAFPRICRNRAVGFHQGDVTFFFFDINEQQIEFWKLDLEGKRWIQTGTTGVCAGLGNIPLPKIN